MPCSANAVVVRAPEEMLRRVRVVDQVGAVFCELGAEVGAVEAGKPERSSGDRRVRTADHLELEIGDDAGERDGRMREKGAVAEAAKLLRAEEGEDDGAAAGAGQRRGCAPA